MGRGRYLEICGICPIWITKGNLLRFLLLLLLLQHTPCGRVVEACAYLTKHSMDSSCQIVGELRMPLRWRQIDRAETLPAIPCELLEQLECSSCPDRERERTREWTLATLSLTKGSFCLSHHYKHDWWGEVLCGICIGLRVHLPQRLDDGNKQRKENNVNICVRFLFTFTMRGG